MRLILTEYINSLKEDGELDKLIQDILRAYQIEIFTKPERGRQFGVDIYAVGKDFEDNNKKKVFLITVKQGDLDRQTWNVDQNRRIGRTRKERRKNSFIHPFMHLFMRMVLTASSTPISGCKKKKKQLTNRKRLFH